MKERWIRGRRVLRGEAWAEEDVFGVWRREEDGVVVVAAMRRFSDSLAAAGDVLQEVWRWVRR
jgi:hypothetical protein